jgi:hypothetical protein
MKTEFYVKDEKVSPWKSKLGVEFKPIVLLLDDRSTEEPLQELVELRIQDEEEKVKWGGKCKGRLITVAVHRLGKFNGIARIEGRVLGLVGQPGK